MKALHIGCRRQLELLSQRVDLGRIGQMAKMADPQLIESDLGVEVWTLEPRKIRRERGGRESLSVLCSEHGLFPW